MNEKVKVAGRKMRISLAEFEGRCLSVMQDEQEKVSPDNRIIDLLCESVRLGREYVDYVKRYTWKLPDPYKNKADSSE